MQIALPENVTKIIETLEKSGFKAYVVGGGVRDALLKKHPEDYDVCTNAKPEEIISLFEKTVPTGIKHGTVTVIASGIPVEVTTFRTDGEYKDFRRPENVMFVDDLKEDLSRRDFTVNAICYSEKDGIVDPFGGVDDLKKKTLRTVGHADRRFKEDALRVLRLFRFASTLEFDIENETYIAAIENGNLLRNVSKERIRTELEKLALGGAPQAVLPLFESGALDFLYPNESISKIPLLPENRKLKFFTFLKLSSKNLFKTLDVLKCSNAFKTYAENLDKGIALNCETRADIKRLLAVLEDDIFDLFSYKSAILGENTKRLITTAKEIIKNKEPYKISQLSVDGEDIIKSGYTGKQTGEKLNFLLEKVIENPILNSKEKLLQLI